MTHFGRSGSLFDELPVGGGEVLRDAGIALVTENSDDDFRDRIVAAFRYWLDEYAPGEFLIEDFRIWWRRKGGEEPHSPNFWGAVSRFTEISGLIEPTGQVRRAVGTKAHARIVLVWRRKA
jgi:hypothetical protein